MILTIDESGSDRWATVCDEILRDCGNQAGFYLEESERTGGTILELGCATGRISTCLAMAGMEVVGVDPSSSMLNLARQKGMAAKIGDGSSLNFVQARLPDFAGIPSRAFSLVIVPNNGFLSLLTVPDELQFLGDLKERVADGGKVIIDVEVPNPEILVSDSDILYHLGDVTMDTGSIVTLWERRIYDPHTQIATKWMVVEESDESGLTTQRFHHSYDMRYIYRWEMQHLLRLCGFEILDLLGDFKRNDFDERSDRMVWVVSPTR